MVCAIMCYEIVDLEAVSCPKNTSFLKKKPLVIILEIMYFVKKVVSNVS